MSFDDQPDQQAGTEVEGADSAGRDVDMENRSGFYAEGDHGAPGFDGFDGAGKNVACTEEVWRFGGDEDVAGANGDANFAAGFGIA